MTNDRAVEILKAIIFMLGRDDYTDEVEEAIHMAIEALEREACADESTCNDLATNLQPSKQDADDTISRAAAIKAIDVKNVNKGIISALQSIIDELPPVQAEIIRCKDCEYGEQDEVGRWFCRGLGCQIGNEDGSGFCADAERKNNV